MFFQAGAKKEEIVDYCSSAVAGVAWAVLYIYLIGVLIAQGLSVSLSNAIVVCAATIVLCAFHFIVTKRYVLTKVPMMFGALASTFFAGSSKWPALMATLCFGVLLAYLCQLGTCFLNESGHWKLPGEKRKHV